MGWPSVSSVYLWDRPEEGSLGTLLSLEEQVLNSTFEACDPQRTGGRGEAGWRARAWERWGIIRDRDWRGNWEATERGMGSGPVLRVLQDKVGDCGKLQEESG